MTIQLSTPVRNARLDAIETAIGASAMGTVPGSESHIIDGLWRLRENLKRSQVISGKASALLGEMRLEAHGVGELIFTPEEQAQIALLFKRRKQVEEEDLIALMAMELWS